MRRFLLFLLILPLCAQEDPCATFSIVARDPETGDLGIAVASRVLAVGAVVPWAEAEVGAVASQAWADPSFGPRGLALLEAGLDADSALAVLLAADPERARRQLAIVDARGGVAVHTGGRCFDFAGDQSGDGFSVQGNLLAGPEVIAAMARAFEATGGELAIRLLAALAAGEEAGGDKRGKQSAALLVVRAEGGYGGHNDRYLDLRVDDAAEPVRELFRLAGLFFAPRHARAWEELAGADLAAADRLAGQLLMLDPELALGHYLRARALVADEPEAAVAALARALALAPRLRRSLRRDGWFGALRDREDFSALLEE